jgi:hypothetical protein
MPVRLADEDFVLAQRDKGRAHGRRFANYVIQVLRLLFNWGKPRKWMVELGGGNPAEDIKMIRRPKGAPKRNRAWTEAEIAAVLGAASGGMKTAIALGAYAGVTEGDAIALPWSAYQSGRLRYSRGKTDVAVNIRAHTDLVVVLESTAHKATIIVVNRSSHGFTLSGFRASFFKLIRDLRTKGKIGDGLTFLGKKILDAGGDLEDVKSVLGHKTAKQSAEYADEVRSGAPRHRRDQAAVRSGPPRHGGDQAFWNDADRGNDLRLRCADRTYGSESGFARTCSAELLAPQMDD